MRHCTKAYKIRSSITNATFGSKLHVFETCNILKKFCLSEEKFFTMLPTTIMTDTKEAGVDMAQGPPVVCFIFA